MQIEKLLWESHGRPQGANPTIQRRAKHAKKDI